MSTMRNTLTDLGCAETTLSYLGDGVYCGLDGASQVWLVVERKNAIHKIALDDHVRASLQRYLAALGDNKNN